MYHRHIAVPHFLRICRGLEETSTELLHVLRKLGYVRPFIVTGATSGGVLGEALIERLSDLEGAVATLQASAADGGAATGSVATVAPSLICRDNTVLEAEKVKGAVIDYRPDVLIGIGGGRVLDVGKYAAANLQLPFISVPTQISNDGICSPVSVLKNTSGKTDSMGARIPVAIVLDLEVVADSPDSTIRAGVGDLVSNIFAVHDWRLAAAETDELLDDYAAMVAVTAASSLYEAASDGNFDLHDQGFLSLLVNGLVLSGIAMELCGSSRPCSGAEHKISHSLDANCGSPASHGEQVALGSIVSAHMQGQDWRRVKRFFERAGLPSSPRAIGLSNQSFAEAVAAAPQTRKDRYTILEKKALSEEETKALIDSIWSEE